MSVDCDCCAAPSARAAENRPGLSQIAYRRGTFSVFRKAIIDRLAGTPSLRGLSSRVSDDYSITAIELWSAVADVLTFYQERIANEAFLGTATLRDSILRLVRLIGYELRPGAAAMTQLALTLEAGAKLVVPAGTRVQSVPGQGETPQKFETIAAVKADSRFNRLRLFPLPTPATPLGPGTTSAIAAPDPEAMLAAAALGPGDRVILYRPDAIEILTVHDLHATDDTLVATWAVPVNADFTMASDASDPTTGAYKLGRSFRLFGFDAPVTVVVAEQKTAGDPATSYLTTAKTDYALHGDGTDTTHVSLDARYAGLKAGSLVLVTCSRDGNTVAVPFRVAAVREQGVQRSAKATTSVGSSVIAHSGTVTQLELPNLGTALTLPSSADVRDVVMHELTGPALRFWPFSYGARVGPNDVYLPGRRAGWSSIEVGRTIEKGIAKPGIILDSADLARGRVVLLTDGHGGAPVTATVGGAALVGDGVSFDGVDGNMEMVTLLGLGPAQVTPITALVSAPLGTTISVPGTNSALNVKIGGYPPQTVTLDATIASGAAPQDVAAALELSIRAAMPAVPTFASAMAWVPNDASTGAPGDSIVVVPGVVGDRVEFGPAPNDAATVQAIGLDPAHTRVIDGVLSAPIPYLGDTRWGTVRVTIGLSQPQDEFIYAALYGANGVAIYVQQYFDVWAKRTAGERIVVFPQPPKLRSMTFLRLALDVDRPISLDTATAVLLGNVAPASQGETVRNEILGDGDASQTFQHFALRKKPVTYVADATPGGVSSSMTLLVNGARWTEVPSLYDRGPSEEVYVTRLADDGTMTVGFGNGVTAARPPTGRQNITANYRQGIGVAGRVAAGRLTTLLDRPTGLKSAINLNAADGGADPETIDRARQAAPGTVRTFRRAISLRDFEDTALVAGEIEKAAATYVWNGERRTIHLTIGAQGGATFSAEGLKRITATLLTERDPNHKLLVDNYSPVPVLVGASVVADERHRATDVLAAARAALLDALSFDNRRFAEPVYISDIFRILQDAEGVVSVDVDVLDLKSRDVAFRSAHGVDDTLGQPQPRLLMLPARPSGSPGVVLPAEIATVELPAQDVTVRVKGGLSL